MATREQLIEALRGEQVAKQFVPYCFISKKADALTVYFEGDPDYSERLCEHVTLYRSLENNELVGCRIKGISGILEDLPNFVRIEHGEISLSMVFLPFRGGMSDENSRMVLNDLAKVAREKNLVLERQ